MKKLLLLILIIFLFSCGYSDLRDRKSIPEVPGLEEKETLVMRENPVQFMARRLNVWTMDYLAFGTLQERKGSSLYKIVEQLSLGEGARYLLFDNKNGDKEYIIKEVIANESPKGLRHYTIGTAGEVLIDIKQEYRDDYFSYTLEFEGKAYRVEPFNDFQKPFSREIIFVFRDEEKSYCYYNKKVSYVNNEYDIVIDRSFEPAADDALLVAIGVFVDHILYEKGYDFKR